MQVLVESQSPKLSPEVRQIVTASNFASFTSPAQFYRTGHHKEAAEMPPSLGRVWNFCKTETFPPAAKKTGTGPICTLTRKPELCGVGQVFAETASAADAIRKIFRSLVGAAQNSRSENSPNNNLPCSIIFGSL